MTETDTLDGFHFLRLSIAASIRANASAQSKNFEAEQRLSRFANAATHFAKEPGAVDPEIFVAAWQDLPPDLQRALVAEFEGKSHVGAFAERFPLLSAPEPERRRR